MYDHEDFEKSFHCLLGRISLAHARLDFNMGLQLAWLGPHLGVKVEHLLNAKRVTFDRRLKMWRRLVLVLFENAGSSALDEFRAWFKQADELKALRNSYVHGRWGVPGKLRNEGMEALLAFVPMHWDTSPNRPDDAVYLSLSDLDAQVRLLESLANKYFKLQKKYLEHAKPRSAAA